MTALREDVLEGANAVAERAAAVVAEAARAAVAARGRFVFAVSGGRTPSAMLRALAAEDVPWEGIRVVQVDERVAPEGHADRNLGLLRASLLDHAPVQPDQVYAMLETGGSRFIALEGAFHGKTLGAVQLTANPDYREPFESDGIEVLRIPANDVDKLKVGRSHYTYLLAPDGTVIDDLMIYRLEAERFLLVVNASNNDKDWAWLNAVNNGEACIDEERPYLELPHSCKLRDIRATGEVLFDSRGVALGGGFPNVDVGRLRGL